MRAKQQKLAMVLMVGSTLSALAATFTNGDFEGYDGSPANNSKISDLTPVSWVECSNSSGTVGVKTETPQAGSYSLGFFEQASAHGAYQSFDTVVDQHYTVEFYLRRLLGTGSVTIEADVFSGTGGTDGTGDGDLASPGNFSTSVTTWSLQEFKFQASSTTSTIRFLEPGASAAKLPLIDTISITPFTPSAFTNGGFDNYTNAANSLRISSTLPTSWVEFGTVSQLATTGAQAGSYLLLFAQNNNPSANIGVCQTVATEAGRRYDLSYYVKLNGTGTAYLTLDVFDGMAGVDGTGAGDIITLTNSITSTSWAKKEISFTAESASTTIRFKEPAGVYSLSRGPLLDSVNLRAYTDLANGGFDSYTNAANGVRISSALPASWVEFGSSASLNITAPQAGSYMLLFAQNIVSAANVGVYQAIATQVGHLYSISYYVKLNGAPTSYLVLDVFDGKAGTDGTGTGDILTATNTLTSTSWIKQTSTFTAESASTTIRFKEPAGINSLSKGPLLDSVTVEMIPRGTLIFIR